ncbi:hypothetical protein CspeluHIS016_0310050 [Cutaneotrichosporon spelunceum]|uniref:Sulphur transport domain-containing protein n=1 Tax=Cutaneotrichosporon spelunceum TaxID=1672016 RepID=A0AAD3TUI1_9TREE|nr:hypothetical protein CspeluHIS016_0310050 [Cutaneotrichosporon spelunceum]
MPFTPVQTFVGGLLMHIASVGLLSGTGRVMGASGIVDGAVLGDHAKWRWAFLAGIVVAPVVVAAVGLESIMPGNGLEPFAAAPVARLALSGALIGVGAKLGTGCTSGHFLCGSSRLSPRSLVAVVTFMLSAIATAKLVPADYLVDTIPAYKPVYPSASEAAALGGLAVAALIARQTVNAILPKACQPSADTANGTSSTENGDGQVSASECNYSLAQLVPYLLSGLTFSLGLIASGMVSPLKVMGFLRVPPPLDTWDPSLLMVVAGAVIPNMIHWFKLQKSSRGSPKPLFSWEKWQVPTRRDITPRLVIGALIFGVGWGLGGVCPGPAIVTAGKLAVDAARGEDVSRAATGWASYFVNMVLGFAAARLVEKAL